MAARRDESGKRKREERRARQAASTQRRRRGRHLALAGIVAGVVILAVSLFIVRWSASYGPPNVLLITLDTTRADYLGCYGRTDADTPNIDRLAAEGVRFDQCQTCSPMTLPAHASIMTSLYPYAHGARRNGTGQLAAANVTLAETLQAAGWTTAATVASFVLNQRFGLAQGFDAYHDLVIGGGDDPLEAERRGDEVCDDALRVLQSAAPKRFCLWVHFYDAHFPYRSARHPDAQSPEAYADEIAFVDKQVGRLLDELARLKLERNTLVVVTADHGEDLRQHEVTHGLFLYETTLHVPLILRWPGRIDAGRVVSQQVRTVDIAPTILELAGLPPWPQAQGVSLKACLTGRAPADLKLASYAETLEAHDEFGLALLRSLTTEGWKYVLAPDPELYDLAVDPAEAANRSTEQAPRAAALRAQLRDLLAAAPAPPPAEPASELASTDIARLESLGYVGRPAAAAANDQSELDRFEPHGGNPRDYTQVMISSTQARWAMATGRFDVAEQKLREVVAALPGAVHARAFLAFVLQQQRRYPEAAALYEQNLAAAPEDSYTRAMYGALLVEAGRFQDGLDQLKTVLQRTPDDTMALYHAALAYRGLGQFDAARQCLELALRIEPRNSRLVHALGVLYLRQNRLKEALPYFEKARGLDPSFPQFKQDLETVRKALRP